MAQTFSPRFVDLVRNYTTTMGTADFVLGPAVNGYSGFAVALNAGERFYYSCVGVDKPAEHEVGRGTLTDKGTIVREPVGGTMTDFTSGTKSIALIAASEWFDDVHAALGAITPTGQALTSAADVGAARTALGLGSASVADSDADGTLAANSDARVPTQKAVRSYGARFAATFADRAALAAVGGGSASYLREKGREGSFVWDASDLSAKVAADPAQGLFIAPAEDRTGKSGAWVRKFDGAVKPDWFGLLRGSVAGANAAANDTAIAAMWSALSALTQSTGSSKVLHTVDLGVGAIEISQPIIPPGVVKISGRGMGMTTISGGAGDCGTMIMPFGCTAFRFDYSRSSLSDLVISGDFKDSEADNHGVHFRQTFFGTNIRCQSMRGDGFYAEGATASGYLADISRLVGCEGRNCRNGFIFEGSDANVIQMLGGTAHNNRQWGISDNGSLGNAFFGVELSGNGTQNNDGVTIGASVVSYSGNLYGCVAGQEAGASANAPSGGPTDTSYWYYIRAGGPATGIPAWFSGMVIRAGGCVRVAQATARSKLTGCYAESDQGKAQIGQAAIIDGGMLAEWMWHNPTASSSGSLVRSIGGCYTVAPVLQVQSGAVTFQTGAASGNSANHIWRGSHASYGPNPYVLSFTGNNVRFAYNAVSTSTFFEATGQNTTDQFGTGVAFPNALWVPNLMVSDNSKSIANGRRIMVDNAAPATQAHANGEMVFNRQSTQGANFGWRCYSAGTPGSWEALYSGYGTNPVGYAAGAGGAVTQATSKSTGVTLNKLSGQVTTNAASLAAGAMVTFTVTVNQVAASDTINLSLAGGALTPGSYRYWIEGVAAGSFKITVENRSAAALAEALVFNFAVLKAAAA